MRTMEEIVAEMEKILRYIPDEDAKRIVLLAQELSEVKAFRLTGLIEQAREAREER